MTKVGLGSRATFVSPYLQRPLRPLKKVLIERAEVTDRGEAPTADLLPEAAGANLLERHKRAAVSD